MARWRAAYFYAYQPLALWAHVLLERCTTRLTRRKRRALRWLIAADRSLLERLRLGEVQDAEHGEQTRETGGASTPSTHVEDLTGR